jgi:Diadenosine tetraphosphate (Ap4A) hydrolase and other HIT family hydrolases
MDCIFCKILKGEIPSHKVYEDDLVYAFLDIKPTSNGETLVIPKRHTLDIDTIDDETFAHMKVVASVLKKRMEETLNIDGLTLIQNNGDASEVKHFHIHLKPFYNKEKEILNVEEIYKQLNK